MNTTRFTLLAAVALTAALAACSPSSDVDPTSTTTSLTAISQLETTDGTSAPLATETLAPSSTAEAPPVTETPQTTGAASQLDGFGLTGQDLDNAEAAWSAYLAYRAFLAEATADPSADWSSQLALLTGDPVVVNTQTDLTRQAKLGTQVTDRSTVTLAGVTNNNGLGFTFSVCVDTSETSILDREGKDAKAPDAPGSYWRHPASITVDPQDGRWVTVLSRNNYQAQC